MKSPFEWLQSRHDGLRWATRNTWAACVKAASPLTSEIQRRFALARDRRRRFRHELAVCAIFRNEAAYMDEWLSLHHAVGVDHFYLYDNRSTDNFRDVLAPWIGRGLVTLADWPDPGGQVGAYNDCIRRFRMEARWIAFLDLDEFLFSPGTRDLRRALARYKGAAAIFVYWHLFGSNGHRKPPTGPVIENFTRCLSLESACSDDFDHKHAHREKELYVTGWAKDGKSIANPRLVRKYYVHRPESVWHGEVVDENFRQPMQRVRGTAQLSCSVLRINHYWSKSLDDLTRKVLRGNANWQSTPQLVLGRWLQRESRLNEVVDETLLEIWRDIRPGHTAAAETGFPRTAPSEPPVGKS